VRGKIKPGSDVKEFAWVNLEEIKKYKLPPAMYRVIKKLKSSSFSSPQNFVVWKKPKTP